MNTDRGFIIFKGIKLEKPFMGLKSVKMSTLISFLGKESMSEK